MNKKNKILVIFFFIGIVAILIGAYLKVNGNKVAAYFLVAGLAFNFISVWGFIIYNFSKITSVLKRD